MSQFETLKKHPFALLILAFVGLDLAMMGSAVGNTRTLAARVDQPWCWVHPFAWSGNRVDVFLLTLASGQLALTTIWAFFSVRMRAIRLLAWMGLAMSWAIVLVIVHYARYNLADLGATFLFQALGVLGGLGWLYSRGYRLWIDDYDTTTSPSTARHQFTLTELLVFSTVASAVCMILSWLALIWGSGSFFSQWFYWNDGYSQFRQFLEMATLGGLSAMLAWSCLADRYAAVRVTSIIIVTISAGWLMIFMRLQYASYVTMTRTNDQLMEGWVAWFGLHTLHIAGVLLVVRWFGYRLRISRSAAPVPVGDGPAGGRILVRVVARVVAVAATLGLGITLVYFVAVIMPRYQANRRLIKATERVGAIGNVPHLGQIHFYVKQPLDDAAVDSLRQHPIVTHLSIFDLQQNDGTLERLPRLQFLRAIVIYSAEVSDDAMAELRRAMPNTAITVHQVSR